MDLHKREAESERGDVAMEIEVGVMHFEDGQAGRNQETDGLQKSEKVRKWILP